MRQLYNRQTYLGFAQRTRKNLLFIDVHATPTGTSPEEAKVHLVTQIVNSMLGIVVFAWERRDAGVDNEPFTFLNLRQRLENFYADHDITERWEIEKDDPKKKTRTLEDLVHHLRNATAHGHYAFSATEAAESALDAGNSLDPSEVRIDVSDWRGKKKREYWKASISAEGLKAFCLSFLAMVEGKQGH